MKKIYILLFLFIISIAGLYAQQMNGLAAFVKSGFYTLSSSSSSSLNKIVPAGFDLHSTSVTLGGEGYYRNNKMLFILDGCIGLEKSKIVSFQEVKVFSEALYTKAGWIVKEKKGYWIYPSMGIGLASLDINTYDTKYELVDNRKSHLINNTAFDLGINADFIVKKKADYQGYLSMISGLRAGYRLSIKNKAWKDFDGNKLYNMPSYAQNGFYITLAIGYGIFIKN